MEMVLKFGSPEALTSGFLAPTKGGIAEQHSNRLKSLENGFREG
jgi:hypothetical protein